MSVPLRRTAATSPPPPEPRVVGDVEDDVRSVAPQRARLRREDRLVADQHTELAPRHRVGRGTVPSPVAAEVFQPAEPSRIEKGHALDDGHEVLLAGWR